MLNDKIVIHGARAHNLKNVDVTIPRDKLVVVPGLSGSGKSSLAFDTLYAEGQRRYVESLSSYARQFLGQMDKPDVDSIDGLSPAISIDQKTTSKNPRSTVGTVTEINDYLQTYTGLRRVPGPAPSEQGSSSSACCSVHRVALDSDHPRKAINCQNCCWKRMGILRSKAKLNFSLRLSISTIESYSRRFSHACRGQAAAPYARSSRLFARMRSDI